jgi:endonuclease-8
VPEGDTIHRIAARLAPRLTGKTLERVTTQGLVRDLAGRTVTGVVAHGKHLVIELDSGAYLRAHLGMNGRFRAYDRAAGDAMLARMSPGRASLALTTDDGVYLWIGAPTIEISPRRAPRHGMAVTALGPDILDPAFDADAAAARAGAHATRPILDVLLDQRVVAGIGNIFKCEALFEAAIAPPTPIGALAPAQIAATYAVAHRLMRLSVDATRASLAPNVAPNVAPNGSSRAAYRVYSRTGQPCPRCEAPIACASLGEPARWTWWCPRCQPAPGDDHRRAE